MSIIIGGNSYNVYTPEQIDNKKTKLEQLISEMKLREIAPNIYTSFSNEGVYFVWNPTTEEMEQLPTGNIRQDGNYENGSPVNNGTLQAHLQGYNFTDQEGVYEKGGKLYSWDSNNQQFKEITDSTEPTSTEGDGGLSKVIDAQSGDTSATSTSSVSMGNTGENLFTSGTGENIFEPVIDDETINNVAQTLNISPEDVKEMAEELSWTAMSKGVDPSEYVSARLVDFLKMRVENPDMSLEDMETQLAINVADVSDIQRNHLQMAFEGKLTQKEYYELLKNDLLSVYPEVESLDDTKKQELLEKMNMLSPAELQKFIKTALDLPDKNDADYFTAWSDFMTEFDDITNARFDYEIENPEEQVGIEQVYKDIKGEDFNSNDIIKASGICIKDYLNKISDNDSIDIYNNIESLNELENNPEIVKKYIHAAYKNLFENGILDDNFCDLIVSNSFAFVSLNKDKTNINDLKLFNYTINAQINLATVANLLNFDDKEKFINFNLASYMEIKCSAANPAEHARTRGYSETQNTDIDTSTLPDTIQEKLKEIFGENISINYNSDCSNENNKYFQIKNGEDDCCVVCFENGMYSFLAPDKERIFQSEYYYNANGELIKSDTKVFDNKKFFDKYDAEYAINYMTDNMNIDDIFLLLGNTTTMESEIQSGKMSFYELCKKFSNKGDELINILNKCLSEKGYDDLKALLNTGDLSSVKRILSIARYANDRNKLSKTEGFTWNANGIIYDEKTTQGRVGNCWYLSGNISASMHQDFINVLKEQVLSIDEDKQTYTVKVCGKSYTYTYEQLKKATELSNGDLDIRALEMAAREFFNAKGGSNPIANGGRLSLFTEFYTGENLAIVYYSKYNYQEIISHINSNEYIATLSSVDEGIKLIDAETGESIDFVNNHAYAVVGSDNEYIFIVNPWDSTKVLKLDKNTFKEKNFYYEDVKVSDLIEGIEIGNSDFKPEKKTDKFEGNTIRYADGSYEVVEDNQIIRYDRNNNIFSIIKYNDDGTRIDYYYTDNNIVEMYYYDSKNTKFKQERYENGQLKQEVNFYDNGMMSINTIYKDQKNYTKTYYNEQGNITKIETCKNGKIKTEEFKTPSNSGGGEGNETEPPITPPYQPNTPSTTPPPPPAEQPTGENGGDNGKNNPDSNNNVNDGDNGNDGTNPPNPPENSGNADGNNSGNSEGSGQDGDGIPWGPGHPDYDALFGDYQGDNGDSQSATVTKEQLIGMGINYNSVEFGGTNFNLSPEDIAAFVENDLNNRNDGYSYQITPNGDGTFTVTRTRVINYDDILSDEDIAVIESWLNKIKNDDSRDLASLDAIGTGVNQYYILTYIDEEGNVHTYKISEETLTTIMGFKSYNDLIEAQDSGLMGCPEVYYYAKDNNIPINIINDTNVINDFWNAYNQGEDALLAWWNTYMNPSGSHDGSGFASSWRSNFGNDGGGDEGLFGSGQDIDWKNACMSFCDLLRRRGDSSAPDTEDHSQDKI